MSYADIPSKRLEPHSRICASTVVHILELTFFENQPADRALSTHLKQNHQLGSRDRNIISETLFSVLRWWGWLKYIAPSAFTDCLEKHIKPSSYPSYEEWFPCLAASWLLEGRPELPPSASWWLHHTDVRVQDIPELQQNAPITERRRCLRPFFLKDTAMPALTMESLFPEWCKQEVECDADWIKLIEWFQSRPPVWLRAQTKDIDKLVGEFNRDNVRLQRHPLMKQALKASFSGVNLRQTKAFLEGRFEIQDAASQGVSLVCAPVSGENWWDCCAGAGGKTLHLAWLMNGKGKIQSTDNRVFKLDDLKKRASRCGFSNIICKEWLGVEIPRLSKHFSGVLVDAPCSCSGTWRRNPGARWTTEQTDIEKLAALQLQLLTNASKAVAPGGTLVYATCSMFKRENMDVITKFLNLDGNEFELVPFESPLTGEPTPGYLQFWPWDSDCDAMFAAKFQRKNTK